MRIYGPYKHPRTQRKIVIIIHDNGKRETISYPKFLMELYLGRKMHKDKETVDHIDSDIDNNSLENFRVLPRAFHSAEDTRRVKPVTLKCSWCNKKFERFPRIIRDKARQGKRGQFCSRVCAGKYGRGLQLKQVELFDVQKAVDSKYYKRKYASADISDLCDQYLELIKKL
jgi:hypothetical protein